MNWHLLCVSAILAGACTAKDSDTDDGEGFSPNCSNVSSNGTPECEIESLARATISGSGGWMLSSGNSKVVDLNRDGSLDLLFQHVGADKATDPNDEFVELQPAPTRVGIAYGPFSGDSIPTTLVEGRLNTFRDPVDVPEVYDVDGDGHLDLLAHFMESDDDISEGGDVGDDVKFGTAIFPGPFKAASIRGFEDGDFVAAPYGIRVGDIDLDGESDLLVRDVTAMESPFPFWFFAGSVNEISAANATSIVALDQFYQPWSTTTNGSTPMVLLGGISGPASTDKSAFLRVLQPIDWSEGGSFDTGPVFPAKDPYQALVILGDVNGDGFSDGAVVGQGLPVAVRFNLFVGEQEAADHATFKNFPNDLSIRALGDINGDAVDDVLLGSQELRDLPEATASLWQYWVLLGPLESRDYAPGDAAAWFANRHVDLLGDLDGDGFADLAYDQPGWPDYVELQTEMRTAGRVGIIYGADLMDALSME